MARKQGVHDYQSQRKGWRYQQRKKKKKKKSPRFLSPGKMCVVKFEGEV
jgi:hypothetical protein